MFKQARLRLTVLNIVLFGLVLALFSVAFYVAFGTVLAPTFDLAPELSNEQAAEAAYQATLDRVGLALLVGDLIAVVLVGIVAWILAARTLRPIREAHARQRRFVADASHEMRTPLAAIRASAEGALSGPASGSGQDLRQALEVVVASADRLTRLTNDLLLLARTDEVPADRRQAVDLSVVIAETAEAFAVAHADLPPPRMTLAEDLRVLADADEIGRIVANLLDNAYRYGGTAGGSVVRMSSRAAERDAIVEVSDAGPGIAGADLDRIFEPFHRVRSDAGAPGGNGLGLAIGRGLAERNGGRLTVASQPGAGSTFRLSLPRFR
jgi:OmpR-family two-component system manganese-sensing sensor histidine kinase